MSTEKSAVENIVNRLDGWINVVTGFGSSLRDKRLSTLAGAPMVLVMEELEDTYAGNKLASKICYLPPFHMLRAGWKVTTGEKQDLSDKIQAWVDERGIIAMLIEAMTWARLHGGAAIIVGCDDGLDPVRPLSEKGIKSIKYFTTLDRWGLAPTRYYQDALAPNYGRPEVYEITGNDQVPGAGTAAQNTGKLIHESRILRFDGTMTTRRRQVKALGWSDSIFIGMWEELRGWGHIVGSTETLITDFAQAVFRMKGLAEIIAAKGSELVSARVASIDMARSTLRAMLIDADGEEFDRKATPMTGLPEMMDRWMSIVSSVADMPATVLFGRSPAGLNATGESDTTNWYDRLVAERTLYVAPKIERLTKLIMLAKDGPTSGVEPQDWRIVYNPLWQMTDNEKAAIRKTQSDTDHNYIQDQVLDPDEVAESRFGGTEYSTETKIDMDARAAMKSQAEETAANPPPPAPSPSPDEPIPTPIPSDGQSMMDRWPSKP